MTDSRIIYRGQAACLVLSLPPTDKNREKAKDIFAKSPFDVTYVRGSDPFSPVAIGKTAKELNPFLYLSYPPSPTQLNTPTFSEEPNITQEEFSQKQSLFESSPSAEEAQPEVPLPTQQTPEEQTPEDPGVFRTPKVEHDECRHKQELFNKLRSINTEKSASDEEENPFDGGLNDEFDMDYDNHVDAERTPTPVVQDDKVNGEDNYDYIQETEESNEIDIKKQSTKKRNIRNTIDKIAILDFSKKMFSKKAPETISMYDYVFLSSVEMLETISKYLDVGDLTSKRYQYWLSKSEGFGGSVDSYQTLDGTNISGRYLYVLKSRHIKTLLRRHKQQHEQLLS
ncbi:unnamed protein product [Mucor hiemalis]